GIERVENALPKNAVRRIAPAAGKVAGAGSFQPRPLDDVEREFILSSLAYFGGVRARAAEALCISERSLRDRLKRWREAGLPGEARDDE
ncbi:MAG: hypothetical protein LBE84_05780, partial [Planctomycetota bacterium]|nr:hypothetical protein [Planctomycetota bacterium]